MTANTADQVPEIHSIANLSPVSPSPVYSSTVSALPTLQSQADFLDSDATDQTNAIAMAHAFANNHASKPDVNAQSVEEDAGTDDDLYGDVENEESMRDAIPSLEQPATEADDEYAKTFDSPLSEEGPGGWDEQEGKAQGGGPTGTTHSEVVGHLSISSLQSNAGASEPTQPSPALNGSSSTTTAADITTSHASSSDQSSSPADIPPPHHPTLPAKPDAEDPSVDVKGARASPPPNGPPQQMPDSSALSPRADGDDISSSRPLHLPVPLPGQPTLGRADQNNPEQSSLPQPPSSSAVSNGRQTLPPASADLPSRPPVDMNRIRGDLPKAAPRHGAPTVKSLPPKGAPQGPAAGSSSSTFSAPGVGPPRAAAPGMTESMGALGPPPGPMNASLPPPPTMPSNSSSGLPLHFPARPVVGGEAPSRGNRSSKWEAFLADEKRYMVEQKWDQFPDGSRVFIGNLSSDKVSKRDVFDLFHRYGRLAQISLKSAFGFVQYHTFEEAQAAVESMQGADVKGRKIHLEFSRTQKKKEGKEERARSTDRAARGRDAAHGRDAGHGRDTGNARGSRFEASQPNRRSRDDNRSGRYSGSDFNPHHREESRGSGNGKGHHRNRPSRDRSQSPRARAPDRPSRDSYRRRSRSPRDRGWAADESSVAPHAHGRDAQHQPVPDVQMLLLQEVDPGYVNWVREAFTERGLRSDAMIVNPTHHIKKDVISRLVVSGVTGIVELDFRGQQQGEVYLHLYDLSGGLSNVRFNEYQGLKPHQAADLVREKSRGFQPPAAHAPAPAYAAHPPPAAYPHHPPHGQPTLQSAASTYPGTGYVVQPPAAQPHGYFGGAAAAEAATIQQILNQLHQTSSPGAAAGADPASIQQILSQLQQASNSPHAAPQLAGVAPQPQPQSAVDIQAILDSLGSANGNAGAAAQPPAQTPPLQPPNYGGYQPAPPAVPAGGPAAPTGATEAQVQNIMAQLARFRQ
ncbi:uncharacterized protein DNG_03925 [Cephalotrichum gorgonifer]|uniref:RRM domain-containing protein n=1 Tax=Cephalotrichum gorgonifer TaxID=2041049 RepID=A0AAE8MXH4_9PEZI|nr:uncharacterized protein DNG_03925 [Cephalotrichum gorgonifer]